MLARLMCVLILAVGCSPAPAPAPPPPPSAPPALPAAPAAPSKAAASPKAEPKRFDFKGDVLGVMTVEEFSSKYPAAVPKSVGSQYASYTVPNSTIATVPAEETSYAFVDGRLQGVSVNFSGDDAINTVRGSLIEKYGTPTSQSPELTWENPTSRVKLAVYDSRAIVFIIDKELSLRQVARENEPEAAKNKAAAKDL